MKESKKGTPEVSETTPEEQSIALLKNVLYEANDNLDEACDDIKDLKQQIRSLTDVLVDERLETRILRDRSRFDRRRMRQYRTALHDIEKSCHNALDAYENGVCKAGDICDLANSILAIVRRF